MTEIFLHIVNMSITASILAVVVLLLRLLLKNAPKWISVLLWGLVALRLICPFAVESPFSLMPKTDWFVQEPLTEEDLFLNSAPDSIPAFDSSSFGSDVTFYYYPIDNPDIEIHRSISISFILSCVWAAGMAALLLHTVISTIRLRKSIGAAVRVRDNIWESSAVESPFVLGMIRPRIYVPRGMSDEKLAYVIAHEEAHIRRRDHWWKPIGFLLLTIHWFNPVLWLAYILLCRDIEMACDERVIKEYDNIQRADYSEALLDCSVKRKMISVCPLAFGEVSVKERIKSVLHYKKPAFWIVILAVIACVVVAVCFLTNPIAKPMQSLEDYDWYFERAYIDHHDNGRFQELYQPGLQPKTENAYPLPGILLPGEEPMRYYFIMGSWDIDRMGLRFIHERTDRRSAHYTVEIYRDTGELIQGADAVMEPLTDGDGYVLTVYYTRDGYETQLIFTTNKSSESVEGNKPLTLADVITLSAKGRALTWEDFYEFKSIETGSGLYIRVYEIDETFSVWIGGGAPIGTPMYIYLAANDLDTRIDIRDGSVEEFIGKHTGIEETDTTYFSNTIQKEIADLFAEIESSPSYSSNPKDYIDAHQDEYSKLIEYGNHTLVYIFNEFLAGGQTGLHGHILCSVMLDLLNVNEIISYDAENGQNYFDHWLASARSVQKQHDTVWLKLNVPSITLVLKMTGDISTETYADQSEEDPEPVDTAISRALNQHYHDDEPTGLMHGISYVMLANETVSGTPRFGQTNHIEKEIYYLLVMHQKYSMQNGKPTAIEGSYIPTILTFTKEDNGEYILDEYWEPRDGAYYDDDIKAKFPAGIIDEVWNMDAYSEKLAKQCADDVFVYVDNHQNHTEPGDF